jgi:serine/threonine protein phosphatase PrpC
MVQIFSHSEAGGHPANEDAFAVHQHPSDAECWICTLADGQGGQPNGGPASKLACQTVMVQAKTRNPRELMEARNWNKILQDADAAVAADKKAGYTTLIGFCVIQDKICGGSNGDSAVALFDATRTCEEPMQSLTMFQIKNPPIGSGSAAVVTFATDLHRPWMILAMSDGVWRYARWDKIKEAAKELRGQELIDAIKQAATLARSGKLQDDFTLVVLQSDVSGS